MISQRWIVKDDIKLFGISYNNANQYADYGVILIPGFSHSSCDIDYFMSKLARTLSGKGLYVMQIDPRGHGDSIGDLKDFSLDTYRDDIRVVLEHIKKNCKQVFCVSRGLGATIFSEFVEEVYIDAIVGINPYCIERYKIEELFKNIEYDFYEIAFLCTKNLNKNLQDVDLKKHNLFGLLGADMSNLYGQQISGQFIQQLIEYNSIEILQNVHRKGNWFITDNENIKFYSNFGKNLTLSSLENDGKSIKLLPENAINQSNLIEQISKLLMSKIKNK